MPKLNVQQTNENVIKAFKVALDTGHRNLLDNPFFTVRQRGDGPFTGNVYGMDRWRGGNSRSTITGNSGYITLATNTSGNGILRQILPQTYEGTYTFSAIVSGNGSGALFFQDSGGTIIGDAVEFTTTGSTQLVTLTFTTSGTAIGGVAVRVNVSNTIEVVCAKLEKGSISTLENDAPPNYAEELAKCQRYFLKLTDVAYPCMCGANPAVVGVPVPTPVTMPDNVQIQSASVGWIRGGGNNYSSSASANNMTPRPKANTIAIDVTHGVSGGLSTMTIYWINFSQLVFSADL